MCEHGPNGSRLQIIKDNCPFFEPLVHGDFSPGWPGMFSKYIGELQDYDPDLAEYATACASDLSGFFLEQNIFNSDRVDDLIPLCEIFAYTGCLVVNETDIDDIAPMVAEHLLEQGVFNQDGDVEEIKSEASECISEIMHAGSYYWEFQRFNQLLIEARGVEVLDASTNMVRDEDHEGFADDSCDGNLTPAFADHMGTIDFGEDGDDGADNKGEQVVGNPNDIERIDDRLVEYFNTIDLDEIVGGTDGDGEKMSSGEFMSACLSNDDTQEMEVYPPSDESREKNGPVVDDQKLSAFADFVDTLDLDDLEDSDE